MKRISRCPSALACHNARPKPSVLTAPPKAVKVPRADIAMATFQGAPPLRLRQWPGPASGWGSRSVRASPKETKRGRSGWTMGDMAPFSMLRRLTRHN